MAREILGKDALWSAVEREQARAQTDEPSPDAAGGAPSATVEPPTTHAVDASALAAENDSGALAPPEHGLEADTEPVAACEDEAIVIAELAAMSPIAYDRERRAAAEKLGVTVQALDAEVRAARARQAPAADGAPFADPVAWPEPVQLAALLDEILTFILLHVVLALQQAVAAALWAVHTYLPDSSEVSPLLLVNAPEKACAKTLLQSLLARICRRPLLAANVSVSALFRAVERWRPTLFIDEADYLFRDNPELIGLVNAGHGRDGFVLRSVATDDGFEPRAFSVFCPKSIAGIALERHLADATMSRGIVINMRRKLPHEKVERLRGADSAAIERIRRKLARFALDHAAQVRDARPRLPNELSDRAQDNWAPLLAIAELAGPEWFERATAAALKLSGASETQASIGGQLLADVRRIFDGRRGDKISTADLLEALCEDDEQPWATYNRGKSMSPRQLAKRLADYGIKSKTVRLGPSKTPKGYERSQFDDAFARYLPPPEQQRPSHNAPQSRGPEVIEAADPGDWPDPDDFPDF